MLDHLQRVLTAREDTVLLTVGYSWGDQHINEIVFDALDVRERVHVVALQYGDPPDGGDLAQRALRRPNLLVYGPRRATVGGVSGAWRLTEEVDDSLADLLDVPFDSDGEPDADRVALTGRFRLGDFQWFARFLNQISAAQ